MNQSSLAPLYDLHVLAEPCLANSYVRDGTGEMITWNNSWFLSTLEASMLGQSCGPASGVSCLRDSKGRPLEETITWLFTLNVLGPHLHTLLRDCPLVPFFATIRAASQLNDATMMIQALALISMGRRAALLSQPPSLFQRSTKLQHWGQSWMAVCMLHWPILPNVALGIMADLISHMLLPECDVKRAYSVTIQSLWTHDDEHHVLDWLCRVELGLMPPLAVPFEEWWRQLRLRVAARPRLQWLDRKIGAHPEDFTARVSTGYGVDSALLDLLITREPPKVWGLWLEFGVYWGGTLRSTAHHLARIGHAAHPVYGFDSFRGLMEDWGVFPQGAFSTHDELPKDLPSNAKLVVGWFNETLPAFLQMQLQEGERPVIQWLHIDADSYTGHEEVLRHLRGYLTCGTVIVFDDVLNYPEWESHGLLALYEFVLSTGWSFEVLAAPWRVDWHVSLTARQLPKYMWWLSRMRALVIRLAASDRCSLTKNTTAWTETEEADVH